MKLIKEFLLDSKLLSPQTLYLPADTQVVNVLNTETGLMLLTITIPDEVTTQLPVLRTFKICTSDEKIYAHTVKYIGSFNGLSGIRHVIEIIKGDQYESLLYQR